MGEYSELFRMIFFIVGVYMFAKITTAIVDNQGTEESKKPKCPPHKWTVEKDIMQCSNCRFIAGSYTSNLGDLQ